MRLFFIARGEILKDWLVSLKTIRQAACAGNGKTRMVVLSHCSNVTGTIQPMEEIGFWCRQQGILLLVTPPREPACCPSTCRPWASTCSPLMPADLPERLESGTLNTPSLAGLQSGINFVRQRGLEQIQRHKSALLAQLRYGLNSLPGIRLYGPDRDPCRGGLLSFSLAGHDPSEIGFLLDVEHNICIRTGLHCAPDAHRSIGLTRQHL